MDRPRLGYRPGLSFPVTQSHTCGRIKTRNNIRDIATLGDGELQEGQIWEAAMTAAHYKLDNLTAIIDNKGLQIDGFVSEVMNIEPIAAKWLAFGWHTIEIDGHDMWAILQALNEAEQFKGMPSVIVAKTIKGKGVSIFENKAQYHGVTPTTEELAMGLQDLAAS